MHRLTDDNNGPEGPEKCVKGGAVICPAGKKDNEECIKFGLVACKGNYNVETGEEEESNNTQEIPVAVPNADPEEEVKEKQKILQDVTSEADKRKATFDNIKKQKEAAN